MDYFTKKGGLDFILMSYASFYLPFHRSKALLAGNSDCRLLWLVNEYNLPLGGIVGPRKSSVEVISNFVEKRDRGFKAWHTINLNLLLMREPNRVYEKTRDLIYYGTFRPGRSRYFIRYLRHGTLLSTSSKNFVKYRDLGCSPELCDSVSWAPGAETLNRFRYSLYIEDERTHHCYNFLANRFYEALVCNTVLLFDRSCRRTVELSGIPFDDDFYVSNHAELMDKVKDKKWEKRREFQKQWAPEAMLQREVMFIQLAKILGI